MEQVNLAPSNQNYRGAKKTLNMYFPRIPALWVALIGGALFLFIFVWFFCRIEPGTDKIAVLIHKTGKDLPSGQIIALQPDEKGILLEVLPEGRYFRNPYNWGWKIDRITDIPAGKVGAANRQIEEQIACEQIVLN